MLLSSLSPKALQESQRRHKPAIEANWRFKEFFNFLQVSPSYRLAHLIATGVRTKTSQPLPMDFDVVEATYNAFGDVYETYFWQWWVKTAQYQFNTSVPAEPRTVLKLDYRQEFTDKDLIRANNAIKDHFIIDRLAQGAPATLVVALPLNADPRKMLDMMKGVLEKAYADNAVTQGFEKYAMVPNKMRQATVDKAREVVRAQAARPNEMLYKIGNITNVSPSNYTDPEQKRAEVSDARLQMEILTSRQLHRAYLLAENAARGRFPTLDPLPEDPGRPKFDRRALHRIYKAHLTWLEGERERLKAILTEEAAARERKKQPQQQAPTS